VGAADDSLKKVMVSGSPKSHQDDSVYWALVCDRATTNCEVFSLIILHEKHNNYEK
jgi:hypothetical protein